MTYYYLLSTKKNTDTKILFRWYGEFQFSTEFYNITSSNSVFWVLKRKSINLFSDCCLARVRYPKYIVVLIFILYWNRHAFCVCIIFHCPQNLHVTCKWFYVRRFLSWWILEFFLKMLESLKVKILLAVFCFFW